MCMFNGNLFPLFLVDGNFQWMIERTDDPYWLHWSITSSLVHRDWRLQVLFTSWWFWRELQGSCKWSYSLEKMALYMGNWGYDRTYRGYKPIYNWLGPTLYVFSKDNFPNYPAQLVSISNINLKSRITWLRNFQRRFAKSLKHFDQVLNMGTGSWIVVFFFRQVSRNVWNKKPPFQKTTRKS